MKLQEKLFEIILKHQPTRTIRLFPWKQMHKVVILIDNGDVSKIKKLLESEGKQVDVFTMPNKKDICFFTARPKSNIRETIQARTYDLLIDLTQNPCLTMLYMGMYIQAGFKTGRYTGNNSYDLTINTPAQDQPNFLFEQIVKYIQMVTQE